MNMHATITIDIVRLLHRQESPILLTPLHSTQILDRQNTREILRALLHAILFHRLFGTIKSQTFEVLDVTMVCVLCPLRFGHSSTIVAAWGRGSECAAPRRGEGECVLEGPRERRAEAGRGSFRSSSERIAYHTDLKFVLLRFLSRSRRRTRGRRG